MNLNDNDKEFYEDKELQKIILDIEKINHELAYLSASINSNIWNIENPDSEQRMREFFVEELVNDLNNQEEFRDKREDLIYNKLANRMKNLKANISPKDFLESIEKVKKINKIENLYTSPRVKKFD